MAVEPTVDHTMVGSGQSSASSLIWTAVRYLGPATILTATLYFWGYRHEESRAGVYGLTPEFFNRSTTDYLLIGVSVAIGVAVAVSICTALWVVVSAVFVQPRVESGSRVVPQLIFSLSAASGVVLLLGAQPTEITIDLGSVSGGPVFLALSDFVLLLGLSTALLAIGTIGSISRAIYRSLRKVSVVLAVFLTIGSVGVGVALQIYFLDLLFTAYWIDNALCLGDCFATKSDAISAFQGAVVVCFLAGLVGTILHKGNIRERIRSVRLGYLPYTLGASAFSAGSGVWLTDLDFGPFASRRLISSQTASNNTLIAGLMLLIALSIGFSWLSQHAGSRAKYRLSLDRLIRQEGAATAKQAIPRTGLILEPTRSPSESASLKGTPARILISSLVLAVIGSAFVLVLDLVDLRGRLEASEELEGGLSSVTVFSETPLDIRIPGIAPRSATLPESTKVWEYPGLRLLHRSNDEFLLVGPGFGQARATVIAVQEGDGTSVLVGVVEESPTTAIEAATDGVRLSSTASGSTPRDLVIGQSTLLEASVALREFELGPVRQGAIECGQPVDFLAADGLTLWFTEVEQAADASTPGLEPTSTELASRSPVLATWSLNEGTGEVPVTIRTRLEDGVFTGLTVGEPLGDSPNDGSSVGVTTLYNVPFEGLPDLLVQSVNDVVVAVHQSELCLNGDSSS